MRGYSGWFASIVLLASCSQQTAPTAVQAPGAQASVSVPTSAPTPPASIDTSPVAEVTVRYDSVKPDVVVVNGRSLPRSELPAQFPAEWRRLSPPTDATHHGWAAFRIHVDAATPFSVIRQIYDAAEAAGARHARFVVDAYSPPSPATSDKQPLTLRLPLTSTEHRREYPNTQLEICELHCKAGIDGKLTSIQFPGPNDKSRTIEQLDEHLRTKIRASRAAGFKGPHWEIHPDDGLRADEIATIIFRCEYQVMPDGRYEPLARDVFLKGRYIDTNPVTSGRPIEPLRNWDPFAMPTPTRRGLGLSNPAPNDPAGRRPLATPPQ